MKKIFMVIALSLFIYGCINNPPANEHPTKEEWLDVYITHSIKQLTDLWEQRISVRVTIAPKYQEIVIGLTSANGQEEISQSAKNAYIQLVEPLVKAILEEYDWVKNYKLTVQYI